MKNKETLFLKALECTSTGKVHNAKNIAEQIISEDPCFAKAHYLLGLILFENLNDIDKARQHAILAIKHDPDNPLGYYLYCDILMANRELEEMKSILKGVANLEEKDKAYLQHKLACVYELKQQYENAIFSLRLSKELKPTNDWESFVNQEISRIQMKMTVIN